MTPVKITKLSQLEESNSANFLCIVVRAVAAAFKTRDDGTKLRVAEVVVGDETATARLRLVGSKAYLGQCELAKANATLVIKNARVCYVNKRLRIEVESVGQIVESRLPFCGEVPPEFDD